jgi:hypothetical protein
MKRLGPTKSVEIDGVPSFVLKGCCEIFVPALKFVFILTYISEYFSELVEAGSYFPLFKRVTSSVGNYRPIDIFNNFFRTFLMYFT